MKLKYINIGGYGVLVDESDELSEGDYCYDSLRDTIWKCSKIIKCSGGIYYKIICAEPELNLDVPILNWRQWEVEQLANSYEKEKLKSIGIITNKTGAFREGFIAGYNHNKKLYTEEDLREAMTFGINLEAGNIEVDYKKYKAGFDKFKETLQKVPKYIVIESDIVVGENNGTGTYWHPNYDTYLEPKLIINSQGKQEVIIKEIIY